MNTVSSYVTTDTKMFRRGHQRATNGKLELKVHAGREHPKDCPRLDAVLPANDLAVAILAAFPEIVFILPNMPTRN
jgi:hypothetical protein